MTAQELSEIWFLLGLSVLVGLAAPAIERWSERLAGRVLGHVGPVCAAAALLIGV